LVTDYGPFTKPTNFTFDLRSGDFLGDIEIYNYNFQNNRLSTITNESGKIVLELRYDQAGRVIEEINADYYRDDFETIKYVYNSEGKIESYVSFGSDSGNSYGPRSG